MNTRDFLKLTADNLAGMYDEGESADAVKALRELGRDHPEAEVSHIDAKCPGVRAALRFNVGSIV